MMPLSARAEKYLHRQQRVASITDPKEISGLLRRFSFPIYEPVLRFQAHYGGLTLYSGLEPLQYGIVHLTSRTRWQPGTFGGSNSQGVWRFECCNTLCQYAFEIDQNGTYFEDGAPIATSFDIFIEGAAVGDELWSLGWRPVEVPALAEPQLTQRPNFLDQMVERFDLSVVTEATDEHSGWWLSDSIALWKRGSRWTILEKRKSPSNG